MHHFLKTPAQKCNMFHISNNHILQSTEQKANVQAMGSWWYACLCMLENCEHWNDRNLQGCSCIAMPEYGNWHRLRKKSLKSLANVLCGVRCVCFPWKWLIVIFNRSRQWQPRGQGCKDHSIKCVCVIILEWKILGNCLSRKLPNGLNIPMIFVIPVMCPGRLPALHLVHAAAGLKKLACSKSTWDELPCAESLWSLQGRRCCVLLWHWPPQQWDGRLRCATRL